MARTSLKNQFSGGTATTATRNRGPGGNRGGNRNRSRGGGKEKSGALYGGEAGGFAAQQDPAAFLQTIGLQGGITGTQGTTFDDWYTNQFTQDLYNNYLTALNVPGNKRKSGEKLTFQDFVKTRFGSGYGGKQGKNFNAGTLGDYAKAQYQPWLSNQDPEGRYETFQTGLGRLGSITGTGRNQFYQDFVRNQGYQNDLARFRTARESNPNLGFESWLTGTPQATTPAPLPALYPAGGKGNKRRRR